MINNKNDIQYDCSKIITLQKHNHEAIIYVQF